MNLEDLKPILIIKSLDNQIGMNLIIISEFKVKALKIKKKYKNLKAIKIKLILLITIGEICYLKLGINHNSYFFRKIII